MEEPPLAEKLLKRLLDRHTIELSQDGAELEPGDRWDRLPIRPHELALLNRVRSR